MAKVFLGLGSNLGDREYYLNFAVTKLDEDRNVTITDVSCIMETPPLVGGPKQGPYLNIALAIDTNYSAKELLDKIQSVENEGNRVRDIKWGPRTIDIDILLFENEVIKTDQLEIPHVEMMNRDFVLKPLVEIYSEGRHPVTNKLFKDALNVIEEKRNEEVAELI